MNSKVFPTWVLTKAVEARAVAKAAETRAEARLVVLLVVTGLRHVDAQHWLRVAGVAEAVRVRWRLVVVGATGGERTH